MAISYGGYRHGTRERVPSVSEIKEDLRILHAAGVRLLRTYNTQQFAHAANLLQGISELKSENPRFEMYVMLGAWIDCEGAWTDNVNHERENIENNTAEIRAAISLTQSYPNIVKIIAVGNEAMVHWAASYFVRPSVICESVNHLQSLKKQGNLPSDLWITSSDNFASWGGGDASYHTDDLTALLKAVDYVSLHTYPFHDTHYNSDFWKAPASESDLSVRAQADAAVDRARDYAIAQYESTLAYHRSLGIDKPIHIGETGWASESNSLYGAGGSKAADEYKAKRFYDAMRDWTSRSGMSCFYFEAFDETWKDAKNPGGSENHFGLFTVEGKAKYALWDKVDQGVFAGLSRGGNPISKTFSGDEQSLIASILKVQSEDESSDSLLPWKNTDRSIGEPVTEKAYLVHQSGDSESFVKDSAYPSEAVKMNVWEGTCGIRRADGCIQITTGTGAWWGCALEIQGDGRGENLARFANGHLHFEIQGTSSASFEVGFQTGIYAAGTQVNSSVTFAPGKAFELADDWRAYSIPISEINKNANLNNVTSLLYLRGGRDESGKTITIRNVYFSNE